MKPLLILKLGGSILTYKKSGGGIRKTFVRNIVQEIASAYTEFSSRYRLVILHGAGSLGHPVVHAHRLVGAQLSSSTISGFVKTIVSVGRLTSFIADSLQDAGIPSVPLQTRLCFRKNARGRIFFTYSSFFVEILKAGGIPIFGGDLILDAEGKIHVISADAIAVSLAIRFPSSKIFFATDVAGIYASFPPRLHEEPLPSMSRRDLKNFLSSKIRPTSSSRDVTGGMIGKLAGLLSLSGHRIFIFDGRTARNISCALRGDASVQGTMIRL